MIIESLLLPVNVRQNIVLTTSKSQRMIGIHQAVHSASSENTHHNRHSHSD
jgi:hypothetical protein